MICNRLGTNSQDKGHPKKLGNSFIRRVELCLKFSQQRLLSFRTVSASLCVFCGRRHYTSFCVPTANMLQCRHVELTTCRYRSSDRTSVLFSTHFFIRCTWKMYDATLGRWHFAS